MKLFPKEKSLDENKLKVAELNELLQNNEEAYKNISKRCEYCHSELTRERDLISLRTKEALIAKKAQGIKLGRPKGKGKSKLDEHKEDILKLIELKVPKTIIAIIYVKSFVIRYIVVGCIRKNGVQSLLKAHIKQSYPKKHLVPCKIF